MTTTPTPPSNPGPGAPHEDEPPSVDHVEYAARKLRLIVNDPERSTGDKRRAIDALGRALVLLRRSLK